MNKNLSLDSKHLRKYENKRKVDKDWWYYEEPTGLCVVHHGDPTEMAVIPWHLVRASLGRKDWK